MPFYLHDQGDLNSQLETYELEQLARMRNRVRILPSPAEIARMGFYRLRRRSGAGLDRGRRREVDYWLGALAFSISWRGADALVRDVT
jgi:predicted nucleic acid-binding protein